jgi:protein-L-isoaspartate(D-aspartate) O-methyltransferase
MRPERTAMIEIIRAYARSEASVLGPQGISERVLEAMGKTERHRFISERSCSVAHMDAPVLIGHGQTISLPYIVALMTHLAALKFDDTVLEVGTGSGYQAAYWRVWFERSVPLRLFHHWPKPQRRC